MIAHIWDRFWDKVEEEPTRGCWLWVGALDPRGYGRFNMRSSRTILAHRFSYRQLVGPIPSWLEVDHLCRNPTCVNPAHLEPVEHRDNMLRGATNVAAVAASKTHCPMGHPYQGHNLYVTPRGYRQCRSCRKQQWWAWWERQHVTT